MGMFDSVIGYCPTCNKELEFQSKAGRCMLARYHHARVPPEIAADLVGHDYDDKPYALESCCGKTFTLKASIKRVSMVVVEWKEGQEEFD